MTSAACLHHRPRVGSMLAVKETQCGWSIGDRHGNTHRVTQVKAIERRRGGDWTATAVVCDCGYKRCVGGREDEEEGEEEEDSKPWH